MQLQHAVITSVDRDDLPDFGAFIFAETIRQIRAKLPGCSVEVLVPDFQGNEASIRTVLEARPDIYNHNTETVPRLYKKCRPGGRYERVMEIFALAKRIAPDIPTKTGMILGMGETTEEVLAVMRDLRKVDVDILTLGQYLRPSDDHLPLDRYFTPDEFRALREPAWRWVSATSSRRRSSARAITPGSKCRPRASNAAWLRSTNYTHMAKKKNDAADAAPLRRALLRAMMLMRRFEERVGEAYALGKIGGFCHLYIGQEGVGTGVTSTLRNDDYVITSYREHGQALARGIPPRASWPSCSAAPTAARRARAARCTCSTAT